MKEKFRPAISANATEKIFFTETLGKIADIAKVNGGSDFLTCAKQLPAINAALKGYAAQPSYLILSSNSKSPLPSNVLARSNILPSSINNVIQPLVFFKAED